MNKVNLNDPSIMNSKEAADMWGIDDSYIRKRIYDFPEGSVRKLGRDWVVTETGMRKVFGNPQKQIGGNNMQLKVLVMDRLPDEEYVKVEQLAKNKSDFYKYDGNSIIIFDVDNYDKVEEYFKVQFDNKTISIYDFLDHFDAGQYLYLHGLQIGIKQCIELVKQNLDEYIDRIWKAESLDDEISNIIKEQMFKVYTNYVAKSFEVINNGNFEWN